MMRKNFKKIIMCVVMTMIGIASAMSQETAQKEGYDWTDVINAIIQVESKGNPNARNPRGDCVGVLQITQVLVRQCNQWLKKEGSTKRYTMKDRYDVEKSKEMFIMVQKYCNPSNNIEKAIRIWNGGPNYKVSSTNGYYRRVMAYYKPTK